MIFSVCRHEGAKELCVANRSHDAADHSTYTVDGDWCDMTAWHVESRMAVAACWPLRRRAGAGACADATIGPAAAAWPARLS